MLHVAQIGNLLYRRIALGAGLLLLCAFAFNVHAQKTLAPSTETLSPAEAAKQGHALAAEILAQQPAGDATSTGVMTITDAKGKRTRIPLAVKITVTATNWEISYEATTTNGPEKLSKIWRPNAAGELSYKSALPLTNDSGLNDKMDKLFDMPFAGSDFSVGDLDLYFFGWPDQKVLKHEMRRSRACTVLESINPHPTPGGYSRVVSWIDNESHGIAMAQAYDFKGKLLKEFIPKKFEKVNGQWQLQEMEIDNDQSDSSTRVDFNVNAPK